MLLHHSQKVKNASHACFVEAELMEHVLIPVSMLVLLHARGASPAFVTPVQRQIPPANPVPVLCRWCDQRAASDLLSPALRRKTAPARALLARADTCGSRAATPSAATFPVHEHQDLVSMPRGPALRPCFQRPVARLLLPSTRKGWCGVARALHQRDTLYMDAAAPRHITLPADAERRRTVIVGDVHGCYDELCLLLDRVGFQPGEDSLILAGDLVNKGPRSSDVV